MIKWTNIDFFEETWTNTTITVITNDAVKINMMHQNILALNDDFIRFRDTTNIKLFILAIIVVTIAWNHCYNLWKRK